MVDLGDSVQFKDASKLTATRVLDMSQCQEVHASFLLVGCFVHVEPAFQEPGCPQSTVFVFVRLCYSAAHRPDVSITTFQQFHMDVNPSCVQEVSSVSLWTRSPERTAG